MNDHDRPAWAARLRAERRARLWGVKRMAAELAAAADPRTRATLPHRTSLARYVRWWEKGEHTPGELYRALYVLAFGIAENELFAVDQPCPAPPASPLVELPPVGDVLARVSGHTGRRVGVDTVATLAARVHALRLADDVLAGGDLIGPAFRELDAAVQVYRRGGHTERVGRELLALIGEFSQIAGWIASDAGDVERAAATYRLGISAAREAGAVLLESNIIGSLAYQMTNGGELAEGVRLAQASLDTAAAAVSGRARALAFDRLAWATARAGDGQASMRALGDASTALDGATADEPAIFYWVDSGELQVMEARVFTELRRPLRAIPLLTDVLGRYDASHTRELALYLSWLAVALVDAGEPEEAAAAAHRMLDLSADMPSERTAARARDVVARLAVHRAVPEVAALLERHRTAS
ncbi:transcriptional regulator [Nonomuraea rhodomycinica]|uniref:Transcriptional regulator n=1 Tax=Nonomuraea rhodomycinica TaxID=1712872 RepID=A0A7Y6MGI8_9ACTN|nr:transcriptional regulator [Nonomuraea rhodomycinica]NUW47012.1 transcriptional regulator [Nonomuraea rhodomycinica]